MCVGTMLRGNVSGGGVMLNLIKYTFGNSENCMKSTLSAAFRVSNVRISITHCRWGQPIVRHCSTTDVENTLEKRSKQQKIDTSKVPVLCEDDLEEWYVKGSGPGGQNVNKRTNCCTLRHKPSGIVVKCHQSRELHENRKLARKMMIEKLDDIYNKEDSVRAQKERLAMKKSLVKEQKSKKVLELKKKYKDILQSRNVKIDHQEGNTVSLSEKPPPET